MKEFFVVLKFEFSSFFKNKAFLITTIILSLMLIIGLSVPTIINTFSGGRDSDGQASEEDFTAEEMDNFGYIDNSRGKVDLNSIKENFYIGNLKEYKTIDELEKGVNENEIEAGFVLESPLSYKHIIKNNEMFIFSGEVFEEALLESYRAAEFKNLGVDYGQAESILNPEIQYESVILGKDSANNYVYTYLLIFALYFAIIMYGQLIASSVASEKSNRAMEVLVTSTKSTNLIFGKVIGVALAGFIQFALIIGVGVVTYSLNRSAWDGALDFVFNIPRNILLYFAVFGMLGYFLYAFIFGALGALVSRTEDVNASATPVTLLFVAVFMISIFGMQNTESIVLKVASFIPFSSFMAMFIRLSMGSVMLWEVLLSLGLLIVTTILIGILASKIYRMGTLRYGNPIKLKDAIKNIRKGD